MKYSRIISHLSRFSLIVVLLVLAGISIWITILNQQAARKDELSMTHSSLYREALYDVLAEESVQFEYALRPSPSLDKEHQKDASVLTSLLEHLQRDGNPADAKYATRLLNEQKDYLNVSDHYFDAIDHHDITLARTVHYHEIDPVFDRIQHEMINVANSAQVQTGQDKIQFAHIQDSTFIITPLIFAIGLLMVIISGAISSSYQKKIDQNIQEKIQHLAQLALTDPLTGLGNHYAYQECLAQDIAEKVHRTEDRLTLALLDIDDFKVFNDEQGHQHGDDILRNFVALFRKANLSNDLFRLGSDDFAALIFHPEKTDIMPMLEQLCKDVALHIPAITLSIGATTTTSDKLNRELLQAQATAALLEAKKRGRNRVLSFAKIEGTVSIITSEKIQALRHFLNEGRMTVAFQPIWNLTQGTILAFEALTRPAPDYGFSGPQELFDLAEHVQRAHELDIICLRAILARAKELPTNVLLFLNLTPQTLVHDLLTEAVLLEAVTSAGLQPSRVILEITERSIVEIKKVVEKVKFLRSLGFRIALDDAGAGNAGLEMLSQLEIDFVKIDRDVVNRAVTDQAAYSVLVGITTIAHESHIAVIAEGIENTEILALVQHVTVQYGQGYLLGRPAETLLDATTATLQNTIPSLYTTSV